MIDAKAYRSKVLLFGEYSVIQKSQALAVPFSMFSGRLEFRQSSELELKKGSLTDPEFLSFYKYILMAVKESKLPYDFDTSSFRFDIDQGLYFKSTIPAGFGLGSSGALCAALFAKYGTCHDKNLNVLKNCLAELESHFHGKSSGLDPLVSYLDKPILQKSESELLTVDYHHKKQGRGGVFLINTGRPRRTEPLVSLFLEKCKMEEFRKFCAEELAQTTDRCINYLLEFQDDKLWDECHKLSVHQYEHFLPMIPPLYRELWKKGLDSDVYKLKLCGAGGGGFLMGMTKDMAKAEESLKHPLKKLFSLF